MRFFSKLTKEHTPAELDTIKEIQDRVREMRRRIVKRDVELADLFSLLGEDERAIMRKVEARQSESKRLHPDQQPADGESRKASAMPLAVEKETAPSPRETSAERPATERLWPGQVPSLGQRNGATLNSSGAPDRERSIQESTHDRPGMVRVWPSQVPGRGEKTA